MIIGYNQKAGPVCMDYVVDVSEYRPTNEQTILNTCMLNLTDQRQQYLLFIAYNEEEPRLFNF